MAKILQRELEDNGVRVITSERIEKIVGSSNTDGDVKVIKTNTNRQIDTDFILLGTGVMPNSEIAKDAGIRSQMEHTLQCRTVDRVCRRHVNYTTLQIFVEF